MIFEGRRATTRPGRERSRLGLIIRAVRQVSAALRVGSVGPEFESEQGFS